MSAIALVVTGSLIGTAGSIYLKKGSARVSLNILSWLKNMELILGIALYSISTVFYVLALKLGDLSIIYPLTSIGYIFIVLASARFLKERIGRLKLIGIFCIIIGVFLITR